MLYVLVVGMKLLLLLLLLFFIAVLDFISGVHLPERILVHLFTVISSYF